MSILGNGIFGFVTRDSREWLIFALTGLVLIAATLFAAHSIGRQNALFYLLETTKNDARLKTALLNIALERPRALPLVLAGDPDVAAALNGEEGAVAKLNYKLEGLIAGTEASVIYVTRADGLAIASSNWQMPNSFIGVNYAFREYYQGALLFGASEHYALGHVSHSPGFYISRRVDNEDGTTLGVVIAKVEFAALEKEWALGGRPVYVRDANGVVLMTSNPDWRFKTLWPLDMSARSVINESRQFGDENLALLPVVINQQLAADVAMVDSLDDRGLKQSYLQLELPVPTTQWSLRYLQPITPTINAYLRESRLVVVAGLTPLFALAGFWLWRRQQIRKERLAAERDMAEMERRVIERTLDLSTAHDKLQNEVLLREDTARELQAVQEDLVKANRLSILGQIAAGVAHEINQPVATIRTYADNARKLLLRKRGDAVDDNLQNIADLTERIGKITSDLKTLARKGRSPAEPVSLRLVMQGAVTLLRSRFSGQMDALKIKLPNERLMVLGTRIRLEQILINLFQNALEAVAHSNHALIRVTVREENDEVAISIIDNGPGIDPAIKEVLFTPFQTTKESGLGLGLIISSDIAADYDGRIDVASNENGSEFTLYLKRA